MKKAETNNYYAVRACCNGLDKPIQWDSKHKMLVWDSKTESHKLITNADQIQPNNIIKSAADTIKFGVGDYDCSGDANLKEAIAFVTNLIADGCMASISDNGVFSLTSVPPGIVAITIPECITEIGRISAKLTKLTFKAPAVKIHKLCFSKGKIGSIIFKGVCVPEPFAFSQLRCCELRCESGMTCIPTGCFIGAKVKNDIDISGGMLDYISDNAFSAGLSIHYPKFCHKASIAVLQEVAKNTNRPLKMRVPFASMANGDVRSIYMKGLAMVDYTLEVMRAQLS